MKFQPDLSETYDTHQKACSTLTDKNIPGEHWRFCLQCGHELINEQCKLRCPRCHYFTSCSDFDFAN